MQRDKRGRFVKKAFDGTVLTLNNKKYKVKNGAKAAFDALNLSGTTIEQWLQTPEGSSYLEEDLSNTSLNGNQITPFNSNFTPSLSTNIKGINPGFSLNGNVPTTMDLNNIGQSGYDKHLQTLKNSQHTPLAYGPMAPKKIKYTVGADGKMTTSYGTEITYWDLQQNPDFYERDFGFNTELKPEKTETGIKPEGDGDTDSEESAGMNFFQRILNEDRNKSQGNGAIIDKTKLANFLELTRAGIGVATNNKIAERALKAEKPFLQDVSESHRSVYGDYRSQIQGEKAAAQLRNMASKPLTSDGALQQQMMMEAQIKGQEYIDQGNARDDAMRRQTQEVAWQQEKENQQQRQAVAMQNKQAMFMSEKNKSQIENMRDSANYSQVVEQYLGAQEQRLRNKGAEQEYYQEYYDDALVKSDVWNTYREGFTESQKQLLNTYNSGTIADWDTYLNEDTKRASDWIAIKRAMQNEIIRKKAALKGVTVNPASLNNPITVGYGMFGSGTNYFPINKKGGTIYKARLTKRTRDNDRGARSLESSRKIAARFLEKAIDSLYDYSEVELIAKPKRKKRKYQAGGGLPFVGFTPVFATSEKGATKASKDDKEDKEDLTTKDVLTLLKDMDGLPSDMQLIVSSLKNFSLQDSNDPLGLYSSSGIASRYISLVNKVKEAKFNREEYNNAFNQLKGNGGLNELAITSEGFLIGTNKEGDFEYFTPDQVNAGEPRKQGYSLLTNSNLLYLRANSLDAAFNHQLTTFAQNGIGMEVITKQINDIISGLGSSKEEEEGFVQMGTKGKVKAGLKYLQKVASEVGDDSIFENMSVADYYQAGYLTEDQAAQAELALNYIKSALPANAKSMLLVKGGSEQGADALLKSMVYSKTSTDVKFKATPKKMTKDSSSSSSSGDGVDALKLSPVQMMQVGYTDHMPITLQKGTKYATVVNAQVLPITDVNKKLLGVTTLDKVAESTFGGALDMNNVTMGSQLIDPHALQNVQIDSTNLYVMNLPIDKSSTDGTIKPDLAWMTKIEEIDQVIREQGITDVASINKLYTDAGLPVLMDDNGQLNINDYCKFGVLNGHALNSAFKDLDLLDSTMLEIDDEDQISNIMSILNKGRGEKDRLDFDSKSWADSLFGTDHDSIYEGTIYIPVRTNAFTGMIGGGNYPDTQTAAEVEALVQQKERTRGYVDPGLLM